MRSSTQIFLVLSYTYFWFTRFYLVDPIRIFSLLLFYGFSLLFWKMAWQFCIRAKLASKSASRMLHHTPAHKELVGVVAQYAHAQSQPSDCAQLQPNRLICTFRTVPPVQVAFRLKMIPPVSLVVASLFCDHGSRGLPPTIIAVPC